MRWSIPLLTVALVGALASPRPAVAQTGSSGVNGMFGSRTLGSGLSPGQSGFSTSPMGVGTAMGGGMRTSTGASGLGFSMGGQALGMINTPTIGGQPRQAGDFVGVSAQQQAGTGFVGAAQAAGAGQGLGTARGAMTGAAGVGQAGRMGQTPGQFGGRFGAQGRTATPQIRIQWTVGFDPLTAPPQVVSSNLGRQLTCLPAIHWEGPLQVELVGRTVILKGIVATEHDRDLAERVARLSPGVEQVQNQLVVAGSALPGPAPEEPLETPRLTPAEQPPEIPPEMPGVPAEAATAPEAANSLPLEPSESD